MRKMLSVILIAAALFGLVAGYMDLTDTLKCKSYWETKGAESDANLDALEAGLNTLKDNKQAYEEGLVTLADGEKALEEGKANYEAGVVKYNAGVEEYNAGLKDYEDGMAAMGKGRNTLLAAKNKLSGYTAAQKTQAKTVAAAPAAQTAYNAINAATNGSTDTATVTAAATNVAAAGMVASGALPSGTTVTDVKNIAAGVANGTLTDAASLSIANNLKTKTEEAAGAYLAVTLNNGVQEYDAGYWDYLVAKGTLAWAEQKLTAAKEQLDAAELELAEGKKTIDEGEKTLEEGRASIKEYEDGVAQVKDGLAQVVATPADGGLMSIADRLGEGFKYTNGDELLLDKGFEALTAAREYSAENGALVTKEIASRVVGCILVLLAAVAGIAAGIVGMLKGSKIGGLLAIVACVAALIGVIVSAVAGATFSAIAGSTGSTLMWVAGAAVAVTGLASGLASLTAKAAAAPAKKA